MPKQTFFNLSEEKRDRLLKVAYHEFSRIPLDEVSINVIIQNSDISRGSFYQYFEDKDDLYFYCLHLIKINQKDDIVQCFKDADGDLFKSLKATFKYLYEHYLNGNHNEFYRHFFVNMSYKRSRNIIEDDAQNDASENSSIKFKKIAELVNQENLIFSSEQELYEFLQYIFQMIHWTISKVFLQNLSEKEAFRIINTRLSWMENGIRKRE